MSALSDTPREDQVRQLRDAAVEAVVVRGWALTPGTWLDDNGRWCGRDGANSVCPVSTSWAHELITSWELAYSTATTSAVTAARVPKVVLPARSPKH